MNVPTVGLFYYSSVVVFLFGATIGSFLNVCIYRVPRDQSVIRPRSHCPHCGKMIAWYDNIPFVSYFALRARCRNCGERIAPRYVIVEALVATLFLLIWFRHGMTPRTPVYWLIAAGLVLGTFVDFEFYIIPDRVSLGGIAAGLVLSPLIPSLHGASTALEGFTEAVIGAVVGAGLLWVVGCVGKAIFKKEAMGMGDVKLLGGIGALMGWECVLFTVMFSSMIGAFAGVGLIFAGQRKWESRIPYGPYIALAAVVWIIWGMDWWQMYLNWVMGTAV